jgi:hypothetical protein
MFSKEVQTLIYSSSFYYHDRKPWLFKAGDECHPFRISLASSHGL